MQLSVSCVCEYVYVCAIASPCLGIGCEADQRHEPPDAQTCSATPGLTFLQRTGEHGQTSCR